MIALWHEAKKKLSDELDARKKLDELEKIDESILHADGLQKYMAEAQTILNRWLKIQTHEEKSQVAAMVVDLLVKSIMIKFD